MKRIIISCALALLCLISNSNVQARRSGSTFKTSTKSYTPKTPYAGYGKVSKVNGMIKTKPISGHYKQTGRGYKYVNSYSRSK